MMNQKIIYYWILLENLLKTTYQLLRGVWKISRLPQPVVTVFGGSHIMQTNRYAFFAHDLMHRLSKNGISIINGGGPGIMQASSCAFMDMHSTKARILSITVKSLLEKEQLNKCVQDVLVMEYFFARKWLMINFSIAFAVFPGGFGTLNELFEVLILMQTESLPGIPVVLIGVDYWQPMINWLKSEGIDQGLITQESFNLLQVTDDIDVASCLLQERCERCKKCVYQFDKIDR